MSATRLRLPAATLLTVALALGTARAATTPKITAAGVDGVKLGMTYTKLRAAGSVGALRPGCELAGPRARSARLRAPLRGSVDFTQTSPRKAATISITGGATARGVGIGASAAKIRRAYPKVVADHGTDGTFGITLYTVPRSGGGRMQFGVDTTTKKVTIIAVPHVPFCE